MYLSRLIDYAEMNNVVVYDNVPMKTRQKIIVVRRRHNEILLVAGPDRDARANYLARALEDLIGHPMPDLEQKTGSICHSVGNNTALR